ncbi:MAG: hypothetical protein FJX29_06550 [Alphaproteobacteria bacterium]|nr:hypothetical protein [Alphaproteobacteria bacterium]
MIIAAGSGVMFYLWMQPVCQGGRVVADEAACRTHFDAAFCASAFARAPAIARTAGPSYQTDVECRQSWPVCVERDPQGYGPRPSGWCVVRAHSGALARFEPQFDNYRQ